MADELVPVIARVNSIAAGTFKPEPAITSEPTKAPEPSPKAAQPLRQAAVGAAWLGPVGVRKIQLTRAGSLIDLGAEPWKFVEVQLIERRTRECDES